MNQVSPDPLLIWHKAHRYHQIYLDKIGVPSHHHSGFGQRLHAHFKDQLARNVREAKHVQNERQFFTSAGIDITDVSDEEVARMAHIERQLRDQSRGSGKGDEKLLYRY